MELNNCNKGNGIMIFKNYYDCDYYDCDDEEDDEEDDEDNEDVWN